MKTIFQKCAKRHNFRQLPFQRHRIRKEKPAFRNGNNPVNNNWKNAEKADKYRLLPIPSRSEKHADDKQKKIALQSKNKLETEPVFKGKIVTQIVPLTEFYPAEGYHRDYYAKNSYAPYCQVVIDPKIQKLLKDYGNSGLIMT